MKSTNLITLLYQSLCVMPDDYLLGKEEIKEYVLKNKLDGYRGPYRNCINQMTIRQKAFIASICKQSKGTISPLSELIKILNKAASRIMFHLNIMHKEVIENNRDKIAIPIIYKAFGSLPYDNSKIIDPYGTLINSLKFEKEYNDLQEVFTNLHHDPVLVKSNMTLYVLESILFDKGIRLKELFDAKSQNFNDNLTQAPGIIGSFEYPGDSSDSLNLTPWLSITIPSNEKYYIRFFYNGREIQAKGLSFYCIQNMPIANPDFPKEDQGILFFQLCVNGLVIKQSKKNIDENKEILIKDFDQYEQNLLNLCLFELNFTIPQLNDPGILAAIKLLKMIYVNMKVLWSEDKLIMRELSHIKEIDFLNPKIEYDIIKHINNFYQILYYQVNPWVIVISSQCPFMFSQRTRMIIFRTTNCNVLRSAYCLKKYSKYALGLDRKSVV